MIEGGCGAHQVGPVLAHVHGKCILHGRTRVPYCGVWGKATRCLLFLHTSGHEIGLLVVLSDETAVLLLRIGIASRTWQISISPHLNHMEVSAKMYAQFYLPTQDSTLPALRHLHALGQCSNPRINAKPLAI